MSSLTRVPRLQLLVIVSVLIAIAELFANSIIGGEAVDRSWGGWIGLTLFGVAVTAVLLLVAVPRIPGDRRQMFVLGFGIGAVVLCAIFWSALPFALGAAAIAAGAPDDDTAHGEGEAPVTAGVLLGALAIVAAFVLCIVG